MLKRFLIRTGISLAFGFLCSKIGLTLVDWQFWVGVVAFVFVLNTFYPLVVLEDKLDAKD